MGISYKRVKEIAVSLGIKTDNALCVKCGIPYGTFHDWKSGNTKSLSEQNIMKLADGLNVPVDALLSDQTDTVIDTLQAVRDEQRILLQATDDMSAEQIYRIVEMIKGFKGEL